MNISSVQIAFYISNIRNWAFDIQVSSDGVTFTDVLTGQKSNHEKTNPETFVLPAGTKARYVRYVGQGVYKTDGTFLSDVNSLTEFIINEYSFL